MQRKYVKEIGNQVVQVKITARLDDNGENCCIYSNEVFIGRFNPNGAFFRNVVLSEDNRIKSGLAFDKDSKVVID